MFSSRTQIELHLSHLLTQKIKSQNFILSNHFMNNDNLKTRHELLILNLKKVILKLIGYKKLTDRSNCVANANIKTGLI